MAKRRWSIDIEFSVDLGDDNYLSVTLVEACLPWHKHYLVCPAKFVSFVVFANPQFCYVCYSGIVTLVSFKPVDIY